MSNSAESYISEIIKCSELGYSKAKTGEVLGISERTVLRYLTKYNLKELYNENTKKFKKDEIYYNVLNLYLKGLTLNLISSELNRQEENIAPLLHRAFIEGKIKPVLCENNSCTNLSDYSYGTGRFCSQSCARSISTKNLTDEQNQARLDGLNKSRENRSIEWAEWREKVKNNPLEKMPYYVPNKMNGFSFSDETKEKLSKSHKEIWTEKRRLNELYGIPIISEETFKRIFDASKKAHAEGRNPGWKSRPKGLQSFPEKYWEGVLIREGLEYTRELKIMKSELNNVNINGTYFLDFVIEINGHKIDLEIDGGQHKKPENMERDKIRDELLTAYGFIVYRIDWIPQNNKINKDRTKAQISDFLNFLDGLR